MDRPSANLQPHENLFEEWTTSLAVPQGLNALLLVGQSSWITTISYLHTFRCGMITRLRMRFDSETHETGTAMQASNNNKSSMVILIWVW